MINMPGTEEQVLLPLKVSTRNFSHVFRQPLKKTRRFFAAHVQTKLFTHGQGLLHT